MQLRMDLSLVLIDLCAKSMSCNLLLLSNYPLWFGWPLSLCIYEGVSICVGDGFMAVSFGMTV